MSIYTFTFLRHGESEGNVRALFQGQRDYPLTPRGREQARALGAYWAANGQTFDGVIASPLSRTLDTAKLVTAPLTLPITTDEIWMERDFGIHSDDNYETYYQRGLGPAMNHPYLPFGKTGESLFETFIRGASAINSLLKRPPGHYLVVSHGEFLNAVLHVVLGIPPQANGNGMRFIFRNTGYAQIRYDTSEHIWHVKTLNQAPHRDSRSEFWQADRENIRLTLVRHGESEGNLKKLWQGQMEFPLTEKGREQARTLAAYFVEKEIQFDSVIASPQSRALETAQIVTDRLGGSLKTDDIWKERHNGKYAGTHQDDRHDEPAFHHLYRKLGDTGESLWELYLRAGNAVQQATHFPAGHHLIAAHGGILSAFVRAAIGIIPQAQFRGTRFHFGNTTVCEMIFVPQISQWRLLGFNNTNHLTDLATFPGE
jgi:broad specificity phosphatase PhoE